MTVIRTERTLGHTKLDQAMIEAGSSLALAKKVGMQAATIRMLAGGVGYPSHSTVRKLTALGIAPMDWFTPASPLTAANVVSDAFAVPRSVGDGGAVPGSSSPAPASP